MNQILITGDEVIRNPVKKQKRVLPINGIATFFAISIIILGICMISGSVYANVKINEAVEARIEPEAQFERDEENNTVKVTVTHIRGITKLAYQWNNEKEKVIDGKNQESVSTTIDLLGGTNTLKVSVTEENGTTKIFKKEYTAGKIPEIQLEAVENGVKVIATSEYEIDYIKYSWDDGENQKIEVGEKEYEGIINVPSGEHTLKLEVVDISGMTATKEQNVVGDKEPTVKVESKLVNGKATFVIDAEDDEKIVKLEIIHNGGEKQTIEVNASTYHHEVIMTEGQTNTIIIKATNINGLSKTRRIKFDNK